MTNLGLKAIQLQGKIRRFVQAKLLPRQAEAALASRRGECNRCGACCKILFACPFLATDEEGQMSCRIYERRFAQCRLYPILARDMLEVEECSYEFAEGRVPALLPGVSPAPVEE